MHWRAVCSCGWQSDTFGARYLAVNYSEDHQDEMAPDNGPPEHYVRIVQVFGGNWLRGGH